MSDTSLGSVTFTVSCSAVPCSTSSLPVSVGASSLVLARNGPPDSLAWARSVAVTSEMALRSSSLASCPWLMTLLGGISPHLVSSSLRLKSFTRSRCVGLRASSPSSSAINSSLTVTAASMGGSF
eukprot:scaffold12183_cov68-Phaeocystis_antarctica.AAC.14